MRRLILILALCLISAAASAATGRIVKVLPQFLDNQGRHALSPSLYDRDAYQFYLQWHTNEVSGMRFAVQWKASHATGALKMRIEILGATHGERPPAVTLEQPVKPGGWFGHWAYISLSGEQFKKIGEVVAWRATLWDGDHLLAEQKSFLW